ncbi:MAG TPA: HAD-IIA family hydrolase [Patescibacteria group bacterium]|nr:HAD-IIA family hydrolase [Patescibacteria group bacterium]
MSAGGWIAAAGVRGALIDLDGTLWSDDRPIAGAVRAVERLRDAGIDFRFLTNTSRRSRAAIAAALGRAGFPADPALVLTPAALARRLVERSPRPRAAFFVAPEARADFTGLAEDRLDPAWVVMGDLADGFTYALLNEAFRLVRAGAELVALHRQRFWRPAGGAEVLDVGPFVAALEYATGRPSHLVGKPSAEFFRLALEELRLSAGEVVMIGDDPESDASGARSAGLRTVLVRTGRPLEPGDPGAAAADQILDSIADLT